MEEKREEERIFIMDKNMLQKTGMVWFLAMICCLLWGSAFPCIKIGYELFQIEAADTASQIVFAGVRFFLAGVLALLFGSVLQRKLLLPERKDVPMILKLSVMQTVVQYLFFYIGLAHTTGVKSSIIEAANVFVAILIASLIFHQEELTGRKMVGCAAGFAGVVLINLGSGGMDAQFRWNGEGFILLSTVAYALSSVFIKRYSAKANPVLLSGWQFCVGGLVMAVVGGLMGGRLTFHEAGCLPLFFYMAVISSVAYTLWAILLKYNPVSKVTVFGFMNPVFGVILSAWLLKENGQAFSLRGLTSLILVCIGIYIVNKSDDVAA
ncbi:MAG: DMT family transporter [Eubacteriales bacterium]|nr:DMT family transporter [Eubacteriales bacterium]